MMKKSGSLAYFGGCEERATDSSLQLQYSIVERNSVKKQLKQLDGLLGRAKVGKPQLFASSLEVGCEL